MGRGSALATALPTEKSFCGFLDDDLAAKFFGVVALLIVTLCFGLIEFLTGSGKLPSSTECSTDPQFMDFEGNDLIKGGIAIEDTAGQPGTLQCCQKCSVMPGAVQWVYHTPLAIGGTETCFCKYAIGTGEPNQQYIAVKIADPASKPWGGAFLATISGVGLLYLLGGVLINQQRGLRDMDMIPNGSQWAALPSYFIDGVMFASTGCSSSARSGGYGPVGPASAVDQGTLVEDVPSMLPDVESLGAEILERDEKERKARKKAAKKSKQKRGSVPSLTDEMQREKDRQKLKDKDKRSRRKSHAVTSPPAAGH
jgi:hypothetical protein